MCKNICDIQGIRNPWMQSKKGNTIGLYAKYAIKALSAFGLIKIRPH